MIDNLTPTMLRDLLELLRAWRAGELRPRPGSPPRPHAPAQSAYGRLYEVTAIGGGTCTVQRPKAGGGLDADSQLAGVVYDADSVPTVGDRGEVLRLAEGSLYFHPGGAGAAPGQPIMLKAQVNMTGDNFAYNCKYLKADGTEGATVSVKRPNSIRVDAGDTGFLGQDSAGANIFVPCHARHDQGLSLTVEVRTSDPSSPEVGRIWWRGDL